MLVLAGAIVAITVVNANYFSPEKTVANYLAALKDGNGAKALGLLHAKVPAANAAALDGPALAASQNGMSNIEMVDAVDAGKGLKRVTVKYTLDETDLSTDFTLAPGPKVWLFFDQWTMTPVTLPTLNASVVNADTATINGVAANMPDGKNSFAVFYPGRYELEYRSPLFAAPAATRYVTGATAQVPAVGLATGPTSELLEQVSGVLKTFLDDCAKQAVLMPTGCPMSAATDNRVVSPIVWTIKDYPTISITPYGGQWVLAPLNFTAAVSYKEQNLFTGLVEDVTTPNDFDFTAKLKITGTTVAVTPVVSY